MTRKDLQAALLNPNVVAFLRAIRLGEGTSDAEGYRRIVGGSLFDSFDTHPRKKIYIPRYDVFSTAAGAYQIIWPTWKNLVIRYAFPDFSPQSQDEAAVALIDGRGGLLFVKHGKLVEAVKACAPEWASLPGSTAGQRTESYQNVEQEYLKWGGGLA